MDDKQIINTLLGKIQKLNNDILQLELNNSAKDLEISNLKKVEDVPAEEEEAN
tara:strand:+ start:243 stop:401 length:159 start_codon:yes stop_codon:yes gene_type:complete